MLNVLDNNDEKTWKTLISLGQILFKTPSFNKILH